MTPEAKIPRYDISVSPKDGNAFAILGAVQAGLRQAGASEAEVKEFSDEATTGDYDHLLQTAMRWVNIE